MSVYTTIFAGASPIGALLSGTLAATAGVGVALVLGGGAALIATGVAAWLVLRSPRIGMSTGVSREPVAEADSPAATARRS
jgi:hypothetical protein